MFPDAWPHLVPNAILKNVNLFNLHLDLGNKILS